MGKHSRRNHQPNAETERFVMQDGSVIVARQAPFTETIHPGGKTLPLGKVSAFRTSDGTYYVHDAHGAVRRIDADVVKKALSEASQ